MVVQSLEELIQPTKEDFLLLAKEKSLVQQNQNQMTVLETLNEATREHWMIARPLK